LNPNVVDAHTFATKNEYFDYTQIYFKDQRKDPGKTKKK